MKILLLIVFLAIFLLSPSAAKAAVVVTSPVAGACLSPGQLTVVRWSASTAPAADHYAVTYRTSSGPPSAWSENSGAWTIGHEFGGLSQTSIGWSVPSAGPKARIWVEIHKKNHTQVELASSGEFNIKANCSPTPPPSSNPPPSTVGSVNPPTPNPAISPTPASISTTSSSPEPPAVNPPTVATRKIVQPNYLTLVLYLSLVIGLSGVAFFAFRYKEKLMAALKKSPNETMVKVKTSEPVQPKELTIDQINRMRLEEQASASEETKLNNS